MSRGIFRAGAAPDIAVDLLDARCSCAGLILADGRRHRRIGPPCYDCARGRDRAARERLESLRAYALPPSPYRMSVFDRTVER